MCIDRATKKHTKHLYILAMNGKDTDTTHVCNVYQYAKGSDDEKPHAFTVSSSYTFFYFSSQCTVCVLCMCVCNIKMFFFFHILNFFTVTDIIKFVVVAVAVLLFLPSYKVPTLNLLAVYYHRARRCFTAHNFDVLLLYAHSIK